ncbi:hypothetical protein [Moorena sp. SIO4G3]|uniref:hypothetical protein n=1 Tax=Moorena sp. SIO4G3 TaxID=2607821 RepID=UPI001429C74B|nr:hypothetical protein [Moorena sp. SIO4G3]NEO81397.1 hypothetical protein [Moorena sp. SIO4G3]
MGETPKTALHRLIKISPSPHLPISLSPHLPISPSPYLPISLSPHLPTLPSLFYFPGRSPMS